MSALRKVLVFLAASGLTFLLLSAAVSTTLVLTFTPNHLKTWLRGSDVYNTVVDNLLDQSQDALAKSSAGNKKVTDQAAVKQAAEKAFTPQFLQSSVESFIDGTTPWLKGKADTPSFAINVSGVKRDFANNIADYARTRYASLPVCKAGQKPDTSDILTVPCQVKGASVESAIKQAKNDVLNSEDFLPHATITPANLTTGEGKDKKPLFEQLHNVPKAYRWAHIAPFVLGTLAVISVCVIIFLSSERRKGIRRSATSLAIVGIMLLVSIWTLGFGINKAEAEINKTAKTNEGIKDTGLALVREVQHSLNRVTLAFGILFLVAAAGLIVYLLASKAKSPSDKAGKPRKEEGEENKPVTQQKLDKSTPATKPKPPKLIQ